jgi:hypothetical protein
VTEPVLPPTSEHISIEPAQIRKTGQPVDVTDTSPTIAQIIERKLSQRPADLRDTARALSHEFKREIARLNRAKPNDPARLSKHDKLVAFLKKVATGWDDLADALDQAVTKGTAAKPEPVFLGKAGEIAQQLHLGLMEWLKDNRTLVIEIPVRVSLFAAGVIFLQWFGADSWAATLGLVGLALKRAPKSRATGGKAKGPRK